MGSLISQGTQSLTSGTALYLKDGLKDGQPVGNGTGGAITHYVLRSVASATAADVPQMPKAPMIVFCIDVSGSMGIKCKGAAGQQDLTRLECMKQAVSQRAPALSPPLPYPHPHSHPRTLPAHR